MHCLYKYFWRLAYGIEEVIMGLPGVSKDLTRHVVEGILVYLRPNDLAQVAPHRPVDLRFSASNDIGSHLCQPITDSPWHMLTDKHTNLCNQLTAKEILNMHQAFFLGILARPEMVNVILFIFTEYQSLCK